MNATFKSIFLSGLCVLALGACASGGQVRGTASVGTTYHSTGTTGTLYYYNNRPLYQPYYRYRAYPGYRYRAYPGYRLQPAPGYHHHRNWRNPPRYHHTRPNRPITRPNRPDRTTPTPPVRRPEVRAPIRVNPIERRQIQ